MDNIIVYVDDADCARQCLRAVLDSLANGDGKGTGPSGPPRPPRRWILLGCAPRVTHRASKWVTNSARESWRGRWADRLFAQLTPLLEGGGNEVITQLAQSTLGSQTEALMRQFGAARLVDARRPRAAEERSESTTPGPGITPVHGQPGGIL
ncbi:hypothetical protein [Polaromonas sp. YR568]|uniref:hypothetical protein n=1 Tax=Polaromonas sp. YR568 TaxID=1855301 RepID=UPI00313806D4